MNFKYKKISLYISCLIIFLIFGVYKFLLPKLIETNNITNTVMSYINDGYKLKIDDVKCSLSWDLALESSINSFNLYEKNNELIKASNIKVKIPLIFLALKKINYAKIYINNIDVNAIKDSDSVLNIQKAFKINTSKKGVSGVKLYVNDYHIQYKDKTLPTIHVDGKNLAFENLKNFKLRLNTDLSWENGEKTSLDLIFKAKKPFRNRKFKLQGNITNLNLSKIKHYVINYMPHVKNISGIIDGYVYFDTYSNKVIGNNCKAKLSTRDIIISTDKYKNYVVIADNAKFKTDGKYSTKNLLIENLSLKSKDYNITAKGSIKKLNRSKKELNLYIKSKKSNIIKLANVIPKNIKIKNDALNKGLKHKINGYMDCELKVKGNTKLPEYYGGIDINNFMIGQNIKPNKSKGKLILNKRKLDINFVIIDKLNNELKINGFSKILIDRKVDLKINASNFDLTNIHKKVLIFADVLNFKSGPLPLMKVKGKCNGKLKIRGPTKTANIDGYVEFINSQISHKGFSGYVLVNRQKLEFNKRQILFKNFIANKNGSNVITDGFCDFEDNTNLTLNLKNTNLYNGFHFIKESSLLNKISQKIKFINQITGYGDVKINLTGKKNDIKSNGYVNLNGTNVSIKGLSFPHTAIFGSIKFNDEDCSFKNLKLHALNSSMNLSGKVKDKITNINISSSALDLGSVFKLIKHSENLKPIYKKMSQIKDISGKSSVVLNLKGDIEDKNIFNDIKADIINGQVKLEGIPSVIYAQSGIFTANKTEFVANKIHINTIGTKGLIDGSIKEINGKDIYDMSINFENIDNSTLTTLKSLNLSPELNDVLAKLGNFSGSASGYLKINDKISGDIIFNKLRAYYLPINMPINIASGNISINDDKFHTNNLNLAIGDSKFNIKGDFSKDLIGNIQIIGTLLSKDADKYLNKLVKKPINIKKSVPIRLSLNKVSPNNLKISGGFFLDKDNIISYKGASFGSKDAQHIFGGALELSADSIKFNNIGLQEFNNNVTMDNAFKNILNDKNQFKLNGYINKDFTNGKLDFFAKKFLDINLVNMIIQNKSAPRIFEDGLFKGNIIVEGNFNNPKILGAIEITDSLIPSMKFKITNASLLFDTNNIYLKDGKFQIADSQVNIDAVIENILEKPFVIKDISITSKYINIDEILKIFEKNKTQNKGNTPILVVKKGVLNSEKLIINNLINENAIMNFSFTPDWIMSLDSFNFNTAGGTVTGNSKIDFVSADIHTDLKFNNIKANAAATTLLQLPNEIYGILNGEAHFKTNGIKSKDLISNANGEAKFQVNSGRLVRLGSLEYLLMAAEVVKSGVTGLSINNVVTLLSPKKSGYFDTINIECNVKNGVLYTDNLVSRGKNLSLYIAGSFDMNTNYSDMTILGRVSKAVTGFLGPIGNFSLNKVINAIPGVQKSDNNNLTSIMPNLSKIPGIDFNDDKFRRFVVNIEGDLYNSKSVKKFRWID